MTITCALRVWCRPGACRPRAIAFHAVRGPAPTDGDGVQPHRAQPDECHRCVQGRVAFSGNAEGKHAAWEGGGREPEGSCPGCPVHTMVRPTSSSDGLCAPPSISAPIGPHRPHYRTAQQCSWEQQRQGSRCQAGPRTVCARPFVLAHHRPHSSATRVAMTRGPKRVVSSCAYRSLFAHARPACISRVHRTPIRRDGLPSQRHTPPPDNAATAVPDSLETRRRAWMRRPDLMLGGVQVGSPRTQRLPPQSALLPAIQ